MKKIFALALAAVMTAGMTTVAFAADIQASLTEDGSAYRVFVKDDDSNRYKVADLDTLEGGDELAILITDATGGAYSYIDDEKDLKGYKVYADWIIGDIDGSAKIDEIILSGTASVYTAVTFKLPEAPATKDGELAGKLNVYKSAADKTEGAISLELTYGDVIFDDFDAADAAEFKGVVPFDGEDEVVMSMFGGDLEFEVDVTGQKDRNLTWTTNYDEEFADKYSYANLDFYTFKKSPSFNKIGTVYIYASEDAFVYEETDEGAKEIKGLKWNPDYEAWEFKTRTLTSYVVSDVELDEQTVTEDKDDSSKTETETGKPNPDTGR